MAYFALGSGAFCSNRAGHLSQSPPPLRCAILAIFALPSCKEKQYRLTIVLNCINTTVCTTINIILSCCTGCNFCCCSCAVCCRRARTRILLFAFGSRRVSDVDPSLLSSRVVVHAMVKPCRSRGRDDPGRTLDEDDVSFWKVSLHKRNPHFFFFSDFLLLSQPSATTALFANRFYFPIYYTILLQPSALEVARVPPPTRHGLEARSYPHQPQIISISLPRQLVSTASPCVFRTRKAVDGQCMSHRSPD